MQQMHKIEKRRGFNGLAAIGQTCKNWPKMQKFTSEATAMHAPLRHKPRGGQCASVVEDIARRRNIDPADINNVWKALAKHLAVSIANQCD